MLLYWLTAFSLTLAIETPLVVVLLRRREERAAHSVLLAVFANLATHPLVWFVFPALPLAPWPRFWASELWATAAEAVFYGVTVRGLPAARAATISFVANAASATFGLVLSATPWGSWLWC